MTRNRTPVDKIANVCHILRRDRLLVARSVGSWLRWSSLHVTEYGGVNMFDAVQLGNNLRAARERRGLSQQQVAEP